MRSKTQSRAAAFYNEQIKNGPAWWEFKEIGYQHYLYGRFRAGGVKKSQYLGKV